MAPALILCSRSARPKKGLVGLFPSLAKTLNFSCNRELCILYSLLRNRIHPHLGHPPASMCFQFSSKLFLHCSLLAAW